MSEFLAFINSNKFPEVKAEVGGRSFSYFVIPQELCPALPDFTMRMTGGKRDGYVLGVSDPVPEEFRHYPVLHEYVEFIEKGIDFRGRCLAGLAAEEIAIQELAVPGIRKEEYFRRRKDFFTNLLLQGKDDPDNF
ncbi:hypothetical protein HYU13_06410 [Candidatus Woesearchaeota archaeon]|nr:hypothetical protein [Candidatus Woesearchaeota archaeon]